MTMEENTEDTSGFYLYQDGGLTHAPNFVENKDYQLYRDLKDTYSYPINGWYWFDSINDACLFYNIPLPKPQKEDYLNFGDINGGNI
jgi:hypothetical protein